METLEVLGGTHISEAARRLAVMAENLGEARCMFNDIELTAKRGDTPEQIAAAYDKECAERGARWRSSPEGKAAAAASAAEIADLQARGEALIAGLPDLDFNDQPAVVDWLSALQPCTDRLGVNLDGGLVVNTFSRHGLTPGMCCGALFDENNGDIYFKWLVGQALDGLAHGRPIHGMFHSFADQWRGKFLADAAAPHATTV